MKKKTNHMNKSFFFFYMLVVCGISKAFAQELVINVVSAPIKITNVKYAPDMVKDMPISLEDYIFAPDAEVRILYTYKKERCHYTLQLNKTIYAKDVCESSFFNISLHDIYKSIFSYDQFKPKDISPKAYGERYRNEIFGRQKGDNRDILSSKPYKTQLGSIDAKRYKQIMDSLETNSVSDSAVYYLYGGMYFDQNLYLGLAYDNYKKAYNYLDHNHKKSEVVNAVLQQFLYRMGRMDEANKY